MASWPVFPVNKETIRRRLLIVLPLLILVIDALKFPVIFESRHLVKSFSIVSLFEQQTVPLGTFRAHRIHVAVDNIIDSNYLAYVDGRVNALLISHFIDSESQDSTLGALGKAVLEKLRQVSPYETRKLVDVLARSPTSRPGEILEVSLKVPAEDYRHFPIDHLFILVVKEDPSGESRDIISKGIAEVLKLAEWRKISTLVIPCLGYNWEDKNSLKFDDCFRPVLESLPVASAPRNIYLSLYSDWPTSTLEEAVASINRALERTFRGNYGLIPVLYRGHFRLTLLLLAVCLLVSSFYAPLTIRNFLIIAFSYIGSAMGSGTIIDFLTQGYGMTARSVVQILVLVVFAVGLPFLVDWNPRNIFSKDKI
jgi:hypothetical protein